MPSTASPARTKRPPGGPPTVAAALLVLLVATLAACRTTTSWEELDRLARTTQARTVVFERDFSLYSPFSLAETRDWLELTREQLAEVAELLAADPAEQRQREGTLVVELRAIEGLRARASVDGERISMHAPERHPAHGIEGLAGARRAIVLVEAPQEIVLSDGRTVRGTWSASEFRSTLRHELAHVVACSEGIRGADWLDEGLAMLVEFTGSREAGDGPAVDPLVLSLGRQEARRKPSLAALLLVEEDVEGIAAGRTPADVEWRPRLLAFFAFLLERELVRGGSLRSTAEGARRAGREELERHEPEWRAWLEPGPLDELDGPGEPGEPGEPRERSP